MPEVEDGLSGLIALQEWRESRCGVWFYDTCSCRREKGHEGAHRGTISWWAAGEKPNRDLPKLG